MIHKNIKSQEKNQIVCAISGKEITEHDDVLRLLVKSDGLSLSLTHKKQKDSIHILLTKQNVNHIRQVGFAEFGENFKALPQSELETLVSKIVALYEKKICASLGFALKTKRAVVGQRAIERFLIKSSEIVGTLILAEGASQEISRKMQSVTSIPAVIQDFPLAWLQSMTGKEKISYLLLHAGEMNKNLARDYKQHGLFSKIKDL